jgi:hypothetical protein
VQYGVGVFLVVFFEYISGNLGLVHIYLHISGRNANRNYYCYVEGESLSVREGVHLPERGTCSRCGFVSSQKLCKACVLLDGLNRGLPRLGIGKTSKVNKAIIESNQGNPRAAGDF